MGYALKYALGLSCRRLQEAEALAGWGSGRSHAQHSLSLSVPHRAARAKIRGAGAGFALKLRYRPADDPPRSVCPRAEDLVVLTAEGDRLTRPHTFDRSRPAHVALFGKLGEGVC